MKEIERAIRLYKEMAKDKNDDIAQIVLQALEKQLNGGWIPVSERLPTEKGEYLVTYGNGKIMTHWYVSELKCWLNKEWIKQVGGVIAWQPLPESYKGVNNESL